jgi:hypothetical protein
MKQECLPALNLNRKLNNKFECKIGLFFSKLIFVCYRGSKQLVVSCFGHNRGHNSLKANDISVIHAQGHILNCSKYKSKILPVNVVQRDKGRVYFNLRPVIERILNKKLTFGSYFWHRTDHSLFPDIVRYIFRQIEVLDLFQCVIGFSQGNYSFLIIALSEQTFRGNNVRSSGLICN